jgi:hypothetical protein
MRGGSPFPLVPFPFVVLSEGAVGRKLLGRAAGGQWPTRHAAASYLHTIPTAIQSLKTTAETMHCHI